MFSRDGVGSSPDLWRFDRVDIEASYETEVAASALQRPEEIAVVPVIYFDQRAVGQDDFIVDHIVTGPADLVTVEMNTTGKE